MAHASIEVPVQESASASGKNKIAVVEIQGFPGSSVGKESACNAGDPSSIPGKIRWRRDRLPTPVFLAFPGGSAGKESTYSAGDLGWEDPLEKGKATHASIQRERNRNFYSQQRQVVLKTKAFPWVGQLLSHVKLLSNPMDCSSLVSSVHGFFRQEYWSGLPFPPPGDLPDPGIEPMSPALTGGFFTTEPPGKPLHGQRIHQKPNYAMLC